MEKFQSCANCKNYEPVADRSGREWAHATGWCNNKTLSTDRRKTADSSWCDQHVMGERKFIPAEPHVPMTQEEVDAVLDAEIVEPEGLTFEYTRQNILDNIATIRAALDEIEQMVIDMAGDLE
jgi:hypothetical protein